IDASVGPIGAQQPGPTSAIRSIEHAYKFASEDNAWVVTLTKDYLAVETTRYQNWADFRDHLRAPLEVLTEIYAPVFFSRIGLRYIDVIQRTRLGLPDVPWRELLQPFV